MTTFNHREDGEFGEGATVRTQSIEPASGETIEEMLAGLDGVTPGPWYSARKHEDADVRGPNYEVGSADRGIAGQMWAFTAAHIARCDPDTMRAILTELQSLRTLSAAHGEAVAWIDPETIRTLQERGRWTTAILTVKEGANSTTPLYLSPASLPLGVKAWVGDYRKSDGTTDYYVMIGNDGREMSLHMHAIRGRAEYEAAEINHVLTGSPKPDFDDFDLDEPTTLKPIEPERISEATLRALICDALLNAFPMNDKIADNYAAIAARTAALNGAVE